MPKSLQWQSAQVRICDAMQHSAARLAQSFAVQLSGYKPTTYISNNLHQREFNLSVYEEAKNALTILCVFEKERWKNHRIVVH